MILMSRHWFGLEKVGEQALNVRKVAQGDRTSLHLPSSGADFTCPIRFPQILTEIQTSILLLILT